MPVETDVKMGQLSPLQRFKLIGVLNSLPEVQFNQVVLALNPPSGLVAPRGTSKGDRTFDLFAWLESPSGPGLEILIVILKEIPSSDIEEFISSTSPRYQVTLDVDADNMDVNQLKQLIRGLGAVIGDDSIRVIKVDRGSLKLDITGNSDKLQRLLELFDSGELTEISGVSITAIEAVDSNTVSQQTSSEYHAELINSFINRAKEFELNGNISLAIDELREALKTHPNSSICHVELGRMYMLKNSFGMARAHIKRALELNASDETAAQLKKELEAYIASKRLAKNPSNAHLGKSAISSKVGDKATQNDKGDNLF